MRILTLTLALAIATGTLQAQHPSRPLPAFSVYDAAGRATPSTAFGAGNRIVLVYVQPGCDPCGDLLEALARVDTPGLASRVVLVIDGSLDQAGQFAAREIPPALHGVAWFADADHVAAPALELRGAPAVVGIEREQVEWTYRGLPQRKLLDSVVRTWLGPVPPGEVR